MSSSLWLVGVAGRRGTAVDRLRVTLCCCLAIWALSWRAAWEVPNFVSGRPLPQQPCAAIALAASNEDEDTTTLWKEALEVERARSQLLLEQLDELKEAVAATRIGEEMIAAKALYEECAVKWGQDEYEQLKGCNDRLQQAIKSLQATSSPSPAPPSGPSATGRLEGIGVAVEVLPPVGRSDEIALVAGAPHVRVSLPLGLQGLMWGSDLTPLFDDEGDRLMVFIATLPLGMRISTSPRPPEALQAEGDLVVVEAVSPSSEAEKNGIRAGDYLRAVSYMAPGEEPGFLDKMLGGQAIPLPKVLKCDGMDVEEVTAAMASNAATPDGTITLLLERPP